MAWNFSTPGNVNDFNDPDTWHKYMDAVSDGILVDLIREVTGREPGALPQADILALLDDLSYVNPVRTPPPNTTETIAISPWDGFPKSVERRVWPEITATPEIDDPNGFFRAADAFGLEDVGAVLDPDMVEQPYPVRHRQDEYVEWAVAPDRRKVTFVSEGYDYFAELFRHDEQKVVDLYRVMTSNDAIMADDLRAPTDLSYWHGPVLRPIARKGEFNPRNRFNLDDGRIVHLSQRANSLGAEVNLAGVSSLARSDVNGDIVSSEDAERVICCNRSGAVNRNSDPSISAAAYGLVLGGYRFTLADPVGLYIAKPDYGDLELPDGGGVVPTDWWEVTRGTGKITEVEDSRILRLELTIPEGEMHEGRQMTLFDLRIGGAPVRYPSQFARLINVHLYVTRWKREDAGTGPVVGCLGTCCSRPGSPLLRGTEELPCPAPFTDKFPGLIAPANPLVADSGDSIAPSSLTRS